MDANLDEHVSRAQFNDTIPSSTDYVEIHDESNMNVKRVSADNYNYESNENNKSRARKFTKATKDRSRASLSDKSAMKTWNDVMKQNTAQKED
uniref:Uncharacterized protein n=1 Tax=Leersia perrieri TaxID=77586 RepID=A0A0D9VXP0_9ORYZ